MQREMWLSTTAVLWTNATYAPWHIQNLNWANSDVSLLASCTASLELCGRPQQQYELCRMRLLDFLTASMRVKLPQVTGGDCSSQHQAPGLASIRYDGPQGPRTYDIEIATLALL